MVGFFGGSSGRSVGRKCLLAETHLGLARLLFAFAFCPRDRAYYTTTTSPTRPGLCKYKHGAKFKGAGISLALVFTSLQRKAISKLCVNTNRCHWKKNDKLEPKLGSCV